MLLKSSKYCRLRLLAAVCLMIALLPMRSAAAGAKESGAGAFFKEVRQSLLYFFRQGAGEEARKYGRGVVQSGRESKQAMKEAGIVTARGLENASRETKDNLKLFGREIIRTFEQKR